MRPISNLLTPPKLNTTVRKTPVNNPLGLMRLFTLLTVGIKLYYCGKNTRLSKLSFNLVENEQKYLKKWKD